MRRKLCRAFACPRRIEDTELFCNQHLGMLTPRLLEPIADNREAPAGVDQSVQRRILTGVQDATAFIAKTEGRASALAQAKRRNTATPGQGGSGGGGGGGGGGGTELPMPLEFER